MSAVIRQATDEALAAMIAASGDEAACDELFRRYRKKVYLWCWNHVHEVDDAVELTQEIFIKVFDRTGAFSQRSRFSTWLYRVVRNHCLNRLDSAAVRRRAAQTQLEDHELPDPGQLEEIRQSEIRGELLRILDRAAAVMKPDELEAFVLHYRDGLTVKEVTRVLGCTNVTGARTLIQNARRKFTRLVGTGGRRHD